MEGRRCLAQRRTYLVHDLRFAPLSVSASAGRELTIGIKSEYLRSPLSRN